MNKKFYTLVAGLLLAGGLTSSAFAQTFAKVTADQYESQYFTVYVSESSNVTESNGQLDAESTSGFITTVETDGSNLWTVKKVAGANGTIAGYQLINKKTGKALSVKDTEGNAYDTFTTSGTQLKFAGNKGGYSNGFNATVNNAWYYKLVAAAPVTYDKAQLEDLQGTKFGILIGYLDDADKNGKPEWHEYTNFEGGNALAGDLYVGEGDTTGGFALYKDSKLTQRVVLTKDKWTVTSSELGEGNKFDVLSAKEYAAEEAKGADSNILADKFLISVPSTVAGEPIEVVATDGTNTYEIVVSIVKKADGTNVNRLTVAKENAANKTADYNNYPTVANGNTYVKFGLSNAVNNDDFIGKLWNIYQNDKIASPAQAKGNEYVPASQVAANYPEGQWLWDDVAEKFVNRESGKTIAYPALRYTDKENVYTDGTNTYTIVEAGTPGNTTVGYLNGFTADQLKQKAFFIGAPVEATGDTIYLAKDNEGVLKLTTEKSEAVEFRLTAQEYGKFANAQIHTTYTALDKKGAPYQEVDTVNFTQYAIAEAVSGDILVKDTKEQRYVLAEAATATLKNNAPFLFKNKTADTYNILFGVKAQVNATDEYYTTVTNAFTSSNAKKLLSAFNVSELVDAKQAYDFVQNDLFVVVDADAQQYRGDFSNAGALDTIKVFRNDDNSYVLYEKGELLSDKNGVKEGFLGMENFLDPQYAEKNPALLADTAIISNTYRPQYMLAVGTEAVTDGWTCPYNPEHNTAEWRKENGGHCADAVQDRPFISGRYLVNLVDSAKAQKDQLKNKFTYEKYDANEPYYRLGFVQAIHVGDSLIIASTNDTINLANNPADKPMTFAFRYVDAERDAFTIETAYEPQYDAYKEFTGYNRGYIKYHNGVPVVTPKASEAWVFDLETLKGQAPTANDEVSAEAGVSVVAANGAVIIKNAAGKKVTISNILGKSIANETVASDNETVAVPAGIVVVAVEGEEAVKVVVK